MRCRVKFYSEIKENEVHWSWGYLKYNLCSIKIVVYINNKITNNGRYTSLMELPKSVIEDEKINPKYLESNITLETLKKAGHFY